MTETWRKLALGGFEDLYQISTSGRVRATPYIFFKGMNKVHTRSRVLEQEENYVYMSNGMFSGQYNVKTLFNKTFPNTDYNTLNN